MLAHVFLELCVCYDGSLENAWKTPEGWRRTLYPDLLALPQLWCSACQSNALPQLFP